jgi:hypothetical protein
LKVILKILPENPCAQIPNCGENKAMGEVMLFSLIAGCSGLQATIAGLWLRQVDHRHQQDEAEEESLTPYDSTEIIETNEVRRSSKRDRDPRMVGWEFKVLRSQGDLFRQPAILQQVCDEEALAGWILLEKLDDGRLRFKRPIAMREVVDCESLGFDPYRSYYGPTVSWGRRALILAGVLALVLPAYFSFALIARLQTSSPARNASPAIRPLVGGN